MLQGFSVFTAKEVASYFRMSHLKLLKILRTSHIGVRMGTYLLTWDNIAEIKNVLKHGKI